MMATETGMMTEGMAPHQSVVIEVMSMRDLHMTENVNAQHLTQVIGDMVISIPLQLVVIRAVTVDMEGHHQKGLIAVQIAMAAPMVALIGGNMTLRGTMVQSDTHPLIEAMGANVQMHMTEAAVVTPIPRTEVMLQTEATHQVRGQAMGHRHLVNGPMVVLLETGPILPPLTQAAETGETSEVLHIRFQS